jgi:hypothetical protein
MWRRWRWWGRRLDRRRPNSLSDIFWEERGWFLLDVVFNGVVDSFVGIASVVRCTMT